MNIFVLDEHPAKAVTMLCDCHLQKMCVETAQILSGVLLRRGEKLLPGMPRPQNLNHPVIVAAEKASSATKWVTDYNEFLHIEYLYRFGKGHACADLAVRYSELFAFGDRPSKRKWAHLLATCCGNLDVSGMDIVSAYRKYYTEVKKPQLVEKGLWHFTNREDWTE